MHNNIIVVQIDWPRFALPTNQYLMSRKFGYWQVPVDTEAVNAGQEPANVLYYDVSNRWQATPAIGGGGSLLSYPPGLCRDDGSLLSFQQGIEEDGSAPRSRHWRQLPSPPGSAPIAEPIRGDGSAPRPTQGRETQETSQILVFPSEYTAKLYLEEHAQAPASSGDGSAPRPPAIGGDGNRVLSTMDEFALLSGIPIPSWSAFGTVVKQKLKVRARHALSFHTTTACQP